jgi:hypothetical protein
MYNPATQVQVLTDANLGSYFQKTTIIVGASPTAFSFKKKKSMERVKASSKLAEALVVAKEKRQMLQ